MEAVLFEILRWAWLAAALVAVWLLNREKRRMWGRDESAERVAMARRVADSVEAAKLAEREACARACEGAKGEAGVPIRNGGYFAALIRGRAGKVVPPDGGGEGE